MESMIGKKITISGMVLRIVADAGDRWEARNTTTQETVFFDKSALQQAIKLAKADVVSEVDEKS